MEKFTIYYKTAVIGTIELRDNYTDVNIPKKYTTILRELEEEQPIGDDSETLAKKNTPEFVLLAIDSASIEDSNYWGVWN